MLPTHLKDHDITDNVEYRLIVCAYWRWIGYWTAPWYVRLTLERPPWPCDLLDQMRDGEGAP